VEWLVNASRPNPGRNANDNQLFIVRPPFLILRVSGTRF
jgi:hypothetical protein